MGHAGIAPAFGRHAGAQELLRIAFPVVPGGIELGARDEESVEIVSGLELGAPYAARGTFILKAEVGKTGLRHEP